MHKCIAFSFLKKICITVSSLIYALSIRLYWLFLKFASFVHPKAKLWINGRRAVFDKVHAFKALEKRPVMLMHCASLGEFEQGRPVLESWRKEYPDYAIVLTFFSPSGYEIRKNYPGVDAVFYLPIDFKIKAQRFIRILHPSVVFFVKYEFWYHYLNELKQGAIPCFLISAIFRPNQLFFKPYGGFFKQMMKICNKTRGVQIFI